MAALQNDHAAVSRLLLRQTLEDASRPGAVTPPVAPMVLVPRQDRSPRGRGPALVPTDNINRPPWTSLAMTEMRQRFQTTLMEATVLQEFMHWNLPGSVQEQLVQWISQLFKNNSSAVLEQ